MDIEALKSLGWIVLWGVAFFVLMRFGCGSHIGGHAGHGDGGHDTEGTEGGTRDPVCGMSVDPHGAAATASYGGATYYFCSTPCRDKFQQEPQRYAGAAGARSAQQGGHHHG